VRLIVLSFALLVALTTPYAHTQDVVHVGEDPLGIPMRIRDFTFPGFLLLTFAPTPAESLGRGKWGVELHVSAVNDFQVSPEVEAYLAQTRADGQRRRLDEADANFVVGLPGGSGFYIDLETDILEFAVHYGVTDRFDVGATVNYYRFSGGILDGTIEGFHDLLDLGQQGRNFVERDEVQVIIGRNGDVFIRVLEPPSNGGFGDPFLFARYTFPGQLGGWRFNLEAGLKPPLASESKALTSGAWDGGLQLTADRRWRRNALILNLAVVSPGDFEDTDFRVGVKVPILKSLQASWIHLFTGGRHTRVFLQALLAEHPLSDLVESDLTKLEAQLTVGVKWDTSVGTWGIGLTENLFNMDNTPDIGVHLSWGKVFG